MRKCFVLMALCLFVSVTKAQVAPDKYWVQFTDKNNTPYSIDKPEEYLSERSIKRRVDYGISIDEKDIPVNPSYIEAIRKTGVTILNSSKWLNGVTIETTNRAVVEAIGKMPFVQKTRSLYDEPLKQMLKNKGFSYEMMGESVSLNGDVRNHYGSAYPQIELLNGEPLHDRGYRGEGIWIGICDSGFEGVDTHEAFDNMREEGRLLGTRDFVYKNGIVYSDDHHGTACLGLMAANVPAIYVGTAPKASYFLCRTENVNYENIIEEYNWVSAAEYLDSIGIDVISTSLGYISFDDEQMTHDYSDLDGSTCVITKGMEIACSRGILCVTAAGNEGDAAFPYIGAPADGKNVLTVGGVKADGTRTTFSSIGPTYDGRIKPDVMSYAYAVTVTGPMNNYFDGNGTSYACPSLAGMAACLWQAKKELSASEIREIIKQSADNYSTPNNEYGYGIPDFLRAVDELNLEDCDIFDEKSLISVFPNPSNGDVKLEVNYQEKVSIQVLDMIGRNVYYSDNHYDNKEEIDAFLSGLDKGIYFIKINDIEYNKTIKLIKY